MTIDQQTTPASRPSTGSVILCVTLGILIGLGTYTFVYAKGFSYLSTDPKACANCHAMNSQYDGWLKSSHHGVAVCADCHVPHSFFAKYWIKAENGFIHSTMFTLQTYPDQIMIRESSKRILNNQCLYCHKELAGHLRDNKLGADAGFCTRCHSGVGH